MVGAGVFSVFSDLKHYPTEEPPWVGFTFLVCYHIANWGASCHKQRGYQRTPAGAAVPHVDVGDSDYGSFATYTPSRGFDAVTQNYAYWLMGAISDSPAQIARLVGLYRAIQSAGAAGAFAMNSALTPYRNELASTWAVCIAGLLFAAPAVHWRIKDHTEDEPFVEAVPSDLVSILSGEKKGGEAV